MDAPERAGTSSALPRAGTTTGTTTSPVAPGTQRSSLPTHLVRTRRERGRPLTITETGSSATEPSEPPQDPTDSRTHSTADGATDAAVSTLVDEEATDLPAPLQGGAPVRDDSPTFAELGVQPEIVEALGSAGIERTFAIQELTLPLALAGEDVIGQARTGTGKTLGFGVPLLQRLTLPSDGTPQALVVVPTRELCLQVARDLDAAGKALGARVCSIYGGRPYETQIAALRRGVEVVVGTPGRLLDLAQQGHLVLAKVHGLVLDEADEMLDLGFLPDVERILGMLPATRQTMLFSATMPGPIITLARTFLTRPTHIRAEQVDATAIGERTAQFAYRAHALDKIEMLARALQAHDRGATMVFTRTKRTAQKVADELGERGFKVGAVHGDLGQGAREHALRAFRSGDIDVLVCTDVAARGIDVTGVTHVVNYQCPDDAKTYIHRIGRTGRAGEAGIAVTLVDWDEMHKWRSISDDLDLGAPELPETYSNSPHLYADLGIPSDATGRTGRPRRGTDADRGPDRTADRAGSDPGDDGESRRGSARSGRRSRSRTRRRAGEVVTGPDTDGGGADVPVATPDTDEPGPRGRRDASSGPSADADGDTTRPRRRRRRGRGGSGRAGSPVGTSGGETSGTPAADAD